MNPWLDQYLSPHAQQGVIAGAFLALGWWVVAYQNRRRDIALRAERREDIQRALLAEIRAHVAALEAQRLDEATLRRVLAEMAETRHPPVISAQSSDRIFAAIIAEVHVLPRGVIDPVVTYYRQIETMRDFARAIQGLTQNDPARAIRMFLHYVEMSDAAREAGQEAVRQLTASIQGGAEALQEIADRESRERVGQIAANLPRELAELRDGLSRRYRDRSDL